MIPSVDELLRHERIVKLRETFGTKRITGVTRHVLAAIRKEVLQSANEDSSGHLDPNKFLTEAVARIDDLCRLDQASGLQNVINATGVVLHTNLGRAPLSNAARDKVAHAASRYCTLEYDSQLDTRGARGGRVEHLLQQLTGAEDALVVNNCAAASLLVLSVLANGGETIVSRGELVEIGGDFRVPDIMATSGTRMVEVGTTNRTSIEDYRKALGENTKLIMRVHPSNYRIVGFVSSPSLPELSALARAAGVPLYEDAGSGLLVDLTSIGIVDESPVDTRIKDGADVVTFSGDKLLGAAQAGLVVGRRAIIQRLRKHPLYRALRCDKLRLAALETTLEAYERESAATEIPTLQMLSLTAEQVADRSNRLIGRVSESANHLKLELVPGESAVGGGAAPTSKIRTMLIALTHDTLSADEIDLRLRTLSPPIISRIKDGSVVLDLRTVFPDEENLLVSALNWIDTVALN
jgi:L-seryl-tRNA(Ser) seleniumtransferase